MVENGKLLCIRQSWFPCTLFRLSLLFFRMLLLFFRMSPLLLCVLLRLPWSFELFQEGFVVRSAAISHCFGTAMPGAGVEGSKYNHEAPDMPVQHICLPKDDTLRFSVFGRRS